MATIKMPMASKSLLGMVHLSLPRVRSVLSFLWRCMSQRKGSRYSLLFPVVSFCLAAPLSLNSKGTAAHLRSRIAALLGRLFSAPCRPLLRYLPTSLAKAATAPSRPSTETLALELGDGSKYWGQWIANQRHGEGVWLMEDGSQYKGSFAHGRAHGYGVFTGKDGDWYEGEWKQDRRHGFGWLVQSDGTEYEGEWLNDAKSGMGKETWTDGTWYEGAFRRGLKHGPGSYSSCTGACYDGEFRRDRMEGEGSYMMPSGCVLTGQWRAGQLSGQGNVRFPSGLVYRGGFRQGLKHGLGVLSWPDGRVCHGEWFLGKRASIREGTEASLIPRGGPSSSCQSAAEEAFSSHRKDGNASSRRRPASRGGA